MFRDWNASCSCLPAFSSETRTVKANPELRESERADTSTFSDEADKGM